MKRWVLVALGGSGLLVPVQPAAADSIWARRDPRYAFLFQDNRARQVGDIVTVVISEATVANDQDARTQNRNFNTTGQASFFRTAATTFGGTGTAGTATGTLLPFPAASGNRQFGGTASLTTNQLFTDRMAATVIDILPNGNLVIEGYRSRVVAGEERVLRVTGVVRQQDVGIGNQVLSQSVANFRISYLGRGPQSRTVNQHYLGRLLNLIDPF